MIAIYEPCTVIQIIYRRQLRRQNLCELSVMFSTIHMPPIISENVLTIAQVLKEGLKDLLE